MLRNVIRNGRQFLVVDPPPGDIGFWGRYETLHWEPELEQVFDLVENQAGVMVDVGAWVGPVALIASHFFAEVYAVEPDPAAFVQLEENAAPSSGRIRPVPLMVGTRDGYGWLGRAPDATWGDGTTSTRWTGDGFQREQVTLEGLFAHIEQSDCALLKIDIEGAEVELLEQAAPFLRHIGSPPILLAVHPGFFPSQGAYASRVAAALDAARYTQMLLAGVHDIGAEGLVRGFENVLCLR